MALGILESETFGIHWGAGFSMESYFKPWSEFLFDIAEEFCWSTIWLRLTIECWQPSPLSSSSSSASSSSFTAFSSFSDFFFLVATGVVPRTELSSFPPTSSSSTSLLGRHAAMNFERHTATHHDAIHRFMHHGGAGTAFRDGIFGQGESGIFF